MKTDQEREAIKARLLEIENAHGGRLTPNAVVDDAKDPDSPLHDCFDWDIKHAAQAYWVIQARELITSVRVKITTEKTIVSSVYYVRDPSAGSKEQGFVSVQTLRTDADMAREAIVNEFSRVADMLRRARELAVVLDAQDDVERLLENVVGLRQRFIETPEQRQ